jgi:flavin reductase (DIM6/NTAB) family NADH-FMN oxidoreductase RutF
MPRETIPIEKFNLNAWYLWDKQWLLLTGGDLAKGLYNTMTVAWGSIGNMWNKPFVQVFVRPNRFTYQFLEQYTTFTLCSFSEEYHRALNILGTKSGRDGDKISEAKLTPLASKMVAAPCFAEAELVIECRKMYWQDLEPTHFLDPSIHKHYPKKDYHRVYFGEIMGIFGTPQYTK